MVFQKTNHCIGVRQKEVQFHFVFVGVGCEGGNLAIVVKLRCQLLYVSVRGGG